MTPAKSRVLLMKAIPGARRVTLAEVGHPSPRKQTLAYKTASTEFVQSLSNLYPREEAHAERR